MYTLIAVDENLFGTIPFLEYTGHQVIRAARGSKDDFVHHLLEAAALDYLPDGKVAFFTRDKDFLKYQDRSYYLYLITLPASATQMEQARLIELALEKDFPGRDNPQFEVNIRHVFRQMDGNHVVEIESAIVVHPNEGHHGNDNTDRARTPGVGTLADAGTEHRSSSRPPGPRGAAPGNRPAGDTSRALIESATDETTGGPDTKLR